MSSRFVAFAAATVLTLSANCHAQLELSNARFVLENSSDPAMTARAQELKDALAQRVWNYFGTDGRPHTHTAAFKEVFIAEGKTRLRFTRDGQVPLDQLGDAERKLVERIQELIRLVEADARETKRRTMQAQQERQDDFDAKTRAHGEWLAQNTTYRALITHPVDAWIGNSVQLYPIPMLAGTEHDVVDIVSGYVIIRFRGVAAAVPDHAVRIRAIAPAIPQPQPFPGVFPGTPVAAPVTAPNPIANRFP